MNTMKVEGIRRVGHNRIEYDYTVKGTWEKYFDLFNPMWVEYSENIDSIADSVAVIPLIGNFIVLASLMDADIYVDEIDREFYDSIEQFIDGFDSIMPEHVSFKSRNIVHADRIVDNRELNTGKKENLLFFSGGVDATYSLISHISEKPALVTVWGADIPCDNEKSWKQAIGLNREVADRYDLELLTIRSNFRKSLNDTNVNEYSHKLVRDWWWSAFHHSVAMMGLAAPLACFGRTKLYFGSSYSSRDKKEWGEYVIASDPAIDNNVRFCGCQVVHDGYEESRFTKTKKITAFYQDKEKPFLRVCYLANTGKNCGKCEKCASAIMSLLICDQDPREYGFEYEKDKADQNFAAGLQEMARLERYSFLSLYTDLQTAYREKYRPEQVPAVLKVFYETELEKLADFLFVQCNECIEMSNTFIAAQQRTSAQYELERAEYQNTIDGLCRELKKRNNGKLPDSILIQPQRKLWRKVLKKARRFAGRIYRKALSLCKRR